MMGLKQPPHMVKLNFTARRSAAKSPFFTHQPNLRAEIDGNGVHEADYAICFLERKWVPIAVIGNNRMSPSVQIELESLTEYHMGRAFRVSSTTCCGTSASESKPVIGHGR